jgi:hypothetical protein
VQEGQFHRSLQETKETFLFLLFAANRLAGVAAQGTEFQKFSATAPQTVDAFVT